VIILKFEVVWKGHQKAALQTRGLPVDSGFIVFFHDQVFKKRIEVGLIKVKACLSEGKDWNCTTATLLVLPTLLSHELYFRCLQEYWFMNYVFYRPTG
jgi:hypothetical protein